jgi:hypothetical protein
VCELKVVLTVSCGAELWVDSDVSDLTDALTLWERV